MNTASLSRLLAPLDNPAAGDCCDRGRLDLGRCRLVPHGATVVRHHQRWKYHRAGRSAHGEFRYARVERYRASRGPTTRRSPAGGRAGPSTIRARAWSNTGALYSFGVDGTNPITDRALGSVASGGTLTVFHAARLTNNTGGTIDSLDISYAGEQWRNGGNPAAQTLDIPVSDRRRRRHHRRQCSGNRLDHGSRAELHQPGHRRNGRGARRQCTGATGLSDRPRWR